MRTFPRQKGQEMNRADRLETLIKENGNKIRSGDVWDRQDGLSIKLTQAANELRTRLIPTGYTVVWHKEENPRDSWYSIEAIQIPAYFDKTGQGEFLHI